MSEEDSVKLAMQPDLKDSTILRRKFGIPRSLVLCVFVGIAILLCTLFRQCYTAMPWDEASLAGIKLAWLRKPLGTAFMTVGLWGICLSAGALFWLAVSLVSGARWSVPVRGIWTRLGMSGGGAWVPMLCVMFCLLPVLFPWAETVRDVLKRDWISGDSPECRLALEAAGKGRVADLFWFLNVPFFMGRQVAYCLFLTIAAFVWRQLVVFPVSLSHERRMRMGAAALLPFLVIIPGLMGVDWLLILQPVWFPSMGPLYMVAYAGVLGLAASILFTRNILWTDTGKNSTGEGRSPGNALSALLLASLMFKAYFAYSLYMLIWYAQIPDELEWFASRWQGGWKEWGGAALGGGLLLPLLLMLVPAVRRSGTGCRVVAGGIVVFSLPEACWMLAPVEGLSSPDGLYVMLTVIAVLVTTGLMFLSGCARSERRER